MIAAPNAVLRCKVAVSGMALGFFTIVLSPLMFSSVPFWLYLTGGTGLLLYAIGSIYLVRQLFRLSEK